MYFLLHTFSLVRKTAQFTQVSGEHLVIPAASDLTDSLNTNAVCPWLYANVKNNNILLSALLNIRNLKLFIFLLLIFEYI